MSGPLTPTEILAASTELLEEAGYERVRESEIAEWPVSSRRVFEDPYGIAAVVVFDTWEDLSDRWTDSQGALVELISSHVSRSEPKAWDGYLVLFTPGVLPSEERETWMDIRYDTSRVRKLLATGEELSVIDDVKRTLLPLLPLAEDATFLHTGSALELLPPVFEQKHGIPVILTQAVVDAFRAGENLMAVLHQMRKGGQE